jgi:uncharacterized protein (TIGR02996 family)
MSLERRRFTFVEGSSNKFWEIFGDGSTVQTNYGKLGTAGQSTVKNEASADAARKLYEKLIAEKTKKGYVEEKGKANAKPAPAAKSEAKPAAKAVAAAPAKKAAPTKVADGEPTYATGDAKLKEAFWKNPDDSDLLRVWADFLLEKGDPRGEYIQLELLEDPTDEQSDRARALFKKLGGKLVGPAREWLNGWSFDSHNGLVSTAGCEAQKLIDGWDEIVWLNPRLTLHVNFKTKMTTTAAKLGELELSRFYYLRMESALTDSAIAAMAPGLRGVKNLSLAGTFLTPKGLIEIAPHLESLECLCIGPHVSDRTRTETCNAFAEAIAKTPVLRDLQVVYFFRNGKPDEKHVKLLETLPKMKKVVLSDYAPDEIDRHKRG